MAEISIKRPIDISFDLVEWDSVVPSLNVRVNIGLKPNLSSSLQLKLNSVWFFCSVWDQFTTSLIANQTATLTDMDRALTIQVTSITEGSDLVITFREEQHQNNYATNIELTVKLDQDSFLVLKEQFKNLPKWW